MPCMQVGPPLYCLSVPHIIDFFERDREDSETSAERIILGLVLVRVLQLVLSAVH